MPCLSMTWPTSKSLPSRPSNEAVLFKNFSGNVQSWKRPLGISFGHDSCTNQEYGIMAYGLRARLRGFGCAGRLHWILEVDEDHDGSGARCARVFGGPIAAARLRSSQTDRDRPAGQHLQRTHGCVGAVRNV